ncbi:MAG TPA: hypothetical protein VGM20_08840 [Gemmatimonadales bacterium]
MTLRRRPVDPYAPLSPQASALSLASVTVLVLCAFGLIELFGEDPAARYSTATLCAVCFAVAAADWYMELLIRKSRLPRFIGEVILAAALAMWGIAVAQYSQSHGGSLRPLTDGVSCLAVFIGIEILRYWWHRRGRTPT